MSNNSLTDIIASFLGEIISSSYNVFAGTFLISFLYILVMNESQPNFLILIGNVSFFILLVSICLWLIVKTTGLLCKLFRKIAG